MTKHTILFTGDVSLIMNIAIHWQKPLRYGLYNPPIKYRNNLLEAVGDGTGLGGGGVVVDGELGAHRCVLAILAGG